MRRPRFTAVPHEFIDRYLPDLSLTSVKVALVIMRLTYGYQRELHTVSLSKIADLTGLSKSACGVAVADLEERGLILKKANTSDDGGTSASTYEVAFEDETPVHGDGRGVHGDGRGVHGDGRAPSTGMDGIRNKENLLDKKKEEPPYVPPPDDSLADHTTFRRIWERKFPKLKRPQRTHLEERWQSVTIGESAVEVAVERFHEWVVDKGNVNSPLMVFLKDPNRWVPDSPANQPPPAPASPGVLPPGAGAVPPLVVVEVTAGAKATHWRDAWLSTWNELVPLAPCLDWSERMDDANLKAVVAVPEFLTRFHEVCTIAQNILTVKGAEANWLTFRWVLGKKAGESIPNWWKVLTTLRGMQVPEVRGTSRSGYESPAQMSARLVKEGRARLDAKKDKPNE